MTANLVLDPRQRAMLAEMGVRVWQPSEVKRDVASQPASVEPIATAVPVPIRREPPLRLPVLERPPVTVGAAPVRYVISNLPTDAQTFDCVLLGEPCTGEAEKLLANMTRVLGDKVFVAQMVPSSYEAESLLDQLQHLSAKAVLLLGPHPAKALLGETSGATPFGKLRGMPHSVEGLSSQVIVSYHPLQLLRQPLAKAQAWLDLRQVLQIVSHA